MDSHKYITKEIQQFVQNLPEEKRSDAVKAISSIVEHESFFMGPLPPPEVLEGYNKVVPDGAQTMFAMFEKEQQARLVNETKYTNMDEKELSGELTYKNRGQVFGFVLAMVCIGASLTLAILGHDTVAGVFGTTTIGALVTVFVIGRKPGKGKD